MTNCGHLPRIACPADIQFREHRVIKANHPINVAGAQLNMCELRSIHQGRVVSYFSRGCCSCDPAAVIRPSRFASTASLKVSAAFLTSPCMPSSLSKSACPSA